MVVVSPCLSEEQFQALTRGHFSLKQVEPLLEHLENCDRCARIVDQLAEVRSRTSGNIERILNGPESDIIDGLLARVNALGQPSSIDPEGLLHTPIPGDAGLATPSPGRSEDGTVVFPFLGPPQANDELGRLGSYRVLRVLGKGGMGVVFLAEDVVLRRQVALKTLRPSLADDPSACERFLREARSMAGLHHDHIAPIYQVGKEGNVPYFAMPLLQGESLETRLNREGQLPPAEVARIGREAALGLAAAHEQGVIHRDVTPANLWLEAPGGRVKLLDFGLARPLEGDPELTVPGMILGTPAYMAPEQMEGRAIPRSDLFGLGAVLYRAATGQSAFPGAHVAQVMRAVLTQRPPSPGQLNPDIPANLAAVIMTLLEQDSRKRPASASVLAEELATVEQSLRPDSTANRPSRRWWGGAIAVVLLLALGGASYQFGSLAVLLVLNKGKLVVKADETAVEVTVKGDKVYFLDSATKREIWLNAGEEIEVTVKEIGSEWKFFTRKFTLTRGGKVILSAEILSEVTPIDGLLREQIPQDELKVAGRGKLANAPQELVAVAGDSRMHQGGAVTGVAVRREGGRLVVLSCGLDKRVKVWDLDTGREIQGLTLHTRPFCFAVNSDGKCVAVARDNNTFCVWKRQTDEVIHLGLGSDLRVVRAAAFSSDGKWLAAGCLDGTVFLWDAATGKEILKKKYREAVKGLAFSPDSKRLACGVATVKALPGAEGRPGGVTVLDATTGRELLPPGPAEFGLSTAFSPDGTLLAGGGENSVKVWEAASGKVVVEFKKHGDTVSGLAFSPDGKMVGSCDMEGNARVWEADTGRQVHHFLQPSFQVYSVGFSPDGKTLAVGGGCGKIRVYDLETGEERWKSEGHVGLCAGKVSPDGKTLLTWGEDGTIRLWDLSGPAPQFQSVLVGSRWSVHSAAISPNGRTLAAGTFEGTVKVWDMRTQQLRWSLPCHRGSSITVAFSPDGSRLASTGYGDRKVCIHDAVTGKILQECEGHEGPVTDVVFTSDNQTLVSCSVDTTVRFWDARSGRQLSVLKGHQQTLTCVALNPGGKSLASGGIDKVVKVWDVGSKKEIQELEHPADILGLTYSLDGAYLVTSCSDGNLRLWDGSGRLHQDISAGPSNCDCGWKLAFTPEGRHLVSGSRNGVVSIYRLARPK